MSSTTRQRSPARCWPGCPTPSSAGAPTRSRSRLAVSPATSSSPSGWRGQSSRPWSSTSIQRAYRPFEATSQQALLDGLDRVAAAGRVAFTAVNEAALDEPWRLLIGGRPRWSKPREVVLRDFTFSHVAHHRGTALGLPAAARAAGAGCLRTERRRVLARLRVGPASMEGAVRLASHSVVWPTLRVGADVLNGGENLSRAQRSRPFKTSRPAPVIAEVY